MADESGANAQVPAPVTGAPAATETPALASGGQKETVSAPDASASAPEPVEKPAAEAKEPAAQPPQESSSDKPSDAADVEMKDAPDTAGASVTTKPDSAPSGEAAADTAAAPTTPTMDKLKARRKSTGLAEGKGKKLAKKGSKARILHLDAKPGDHFFVKLKGYPQWPVVVCDDDMLPSTLLTSRPVSAKRPDGTYRADFADGGKRAPDRTFPVMYLHTNEFGWVPNSDLHDLDPTTVLDLVNDKMRKDLQKAHQLAAEAKPLSYYKDILREYQDNLQKQAEEEREAAEKKEAAQAAKKAKKSKPAPAAEEEGDVEMGEAGDEAGTASEKKSKKRKAEDDTPAPQRADSVKKPKFKVISNSTPKSAANGTPTPKSAKSDAKPSKSKAKKEGKAEDKKVEKEAQVPKEPELSPEEKHQRKEKEVLFLRHKLQKGLLTRDQEPKAEEMKMMSDYITKLEGFPDLEVSIIRATKINKVLKAILKLESIPKEDEFHFKTRSQTLLDKWNKLLAVDVAPAAPSPVPAAASKPAADDVASSNGVNGKLADKASSKEDGPKADKTEVTNGIKENGEAKPAKAPAGPAEVKESKAKTDETATAAE